MPTTTGTKWSPKGIVKTLFLEEIFINNDNACLESPELLFSCPLLDLDGKITFFAIGEIYTLKLYLLSEKLNELGKDFEIFVTNNFVKAIKSTNLFWIAELAIMKRKEIKETTKKINLQKKPYLGLLAINENG